MLCYENYRISINNASNSNKLSAFARLLSCVLPFVPEFNGIVCFAITQNQYTSIKHKTEISSTLAIRCETDFICRISFYSSEFCENSIYKYIVDINYNTGIMFLCLYKCIHCIFCHNISASENVIGVIFIRIYAFRHKPRRVDNSIGLLLS